jgi:hypothetical protein
LYRSFSLLPQLYVGPNEGHEILLSAIGLSQRSEHRTCRIQSRNSYHCTARFVSSSFRFPPLFLFSFSFFRAFLTSFEFLFLPFLSLSEHRECLVASKLWGHSAPWQQLITRQFLLQFPSFDGKLTTTCLMGPVVCKGLIKYLLANISFDFMTLYRRH